MFISLLYSDLALILVRHPEFENVKDVLNQVITANDFIDLHGGHIGHGSSFTEYGSEGLDVVRSSTDVFRYAKTTLFRELISEMPGMYACMSVRRFNDL